MAKTVTIEGDVKSFENVVRRIPKDKWIFNPNVKDSPCSKFPMIECPNCGGGLLGDFAPHGIHADGQVYESVKCERDECDFHNHILLEGWTFGEIKRGKKI